MANKKSKEKKTSKKEEKKVLKDENKTKKSQNKKSKKTKNKKILKEKIEKKKAKKKIIIAKRNVVIAFILTLLMLAFTIFIAFLIIKNTFRPKDFANYLPYEKTVFFAEINTDLKHLQNLKTFKLIEEEKGLSLNDIIEIFENQYGFSFENEVAPWLKRKVGIASIKINEHTERLIYFCEVENKELANDFFNIIRPEEIYKNTNIYKSDNKLFLDEVYTVNLDSYYIFSKDIDALKTIIDTDLESFKLSDSEKYRKIITNLPPQKIAFLFIDYTKVNTINLAEISENLSYITTETLVHILDQNHSEGIAVVAQDDKFLIKTFVNYLNNNEDVKGPKLAYKGNLLTHAPKDSIMFFGGMSLKDHLDSVKFTIYNEIFSQLFTNQIDLENDILPLFDTEFLVLLNEEKDGGKTSFSFILDISNIDKDKVDKIVQNFVNKNAGFDEKTIKRELEDGTSYYEVVAVNKNIPLQTIDHNGNQISYYEVLEKDFSIYFIEKDQKLYLSFSLEILTQILDLKAEQSIKNAYTYTSYIAEIQKYSDEITYINFPKLADIKGVKFTKVFDLFDIYTHGKTYFDDGLITINLLKIK